MAIDPKKSALLILAKKKPSASDDGSDEGMDGSPSPGAISAMEDFIQAVKEGDAKGACKAMDAYYDQMDSDDEG